ncbi:tape measure protein [Halomonas sp. BMC6]|uniref:tape measure protein n=2 Tax=Pseudomonadota TaxID=1224 RepID=UPI0030D27947
MNKQGDDLVVVLSLDGNDFEVGIRGAGRLLSQFENRAVSSAAQVKKLDTSVEGLAAKTRDLTIILATAEQALGTIFRATFGWQMAIMNAAGEIEKLTVMMRGMSSESDMAKRNMDALADTKFVTDFAQNAPFTMESITDAFIKFRTVGLEPTDGSMKALTDAVATFGGNGDILHRASIAIQQMVGKGVISMEELRQQLGEAVPSAMAIMARSMGLSMSELVVKIESGTVESRTALNKMLSEMALTFDGAGVRMMTTWQGVLQSMNTRWKLFLKDVAGSAEDSDSYFSTVKDMADRMSQWLTSSEAKLFAQELSEAMKELAFWMEKGLVFIYENRDAIQSLLKVFATWYVVSRATQITHSLITAMMSLNTQTGMLGTSLQNYRRHMDAARATALTTANAVDAASSSSQRASIAFGGLAGSVGRVGMALASMAGPAFAAVSILYTAYQAIKELTGGVDEATRTILESRGLLATTENVDQIRERFQEKTAELEREEAWLAQYQSRAVNPRLSQYERGQAQSLVDATTVQIERLRAEADEAQRALEVGEQGLHYLNVERSKASVERMLQHQIDPLRAAFREQREEHSRMLTEARGNQERVDEVNRLAIQSAQDLLDGQLQVISSNLAAEQAVIDRYKDSSGELSETAKAEVARAEAAIAALRENEIAFREQHRNFVESYEQANQYVEKPSTAKPKTPQFIKDSERALASMGTLANGFAIRLAQVRGTAEEINPHLEGLNERISQLAESITDKDRTMFDQLSAQARDFAEELYNIERLKKAETDGQKAYMQLLGKTAGFMEDTEEGRLMRLRLQTLELNEQVKEYEELLEKMREAGVDTSQIAQFSDALRQYQAEALRDIEKNAESSWEKMLREMNDFKMDWANLWKETADLAIDEMVRFVKEGKFSFSGLIDHVLEQMLRVQLQKSMITPMTNALDGIVGGLLKGATGSAIAGGFATQVNTSPAIAGGFMGQIGGITASANGNIMTDMGPLPLQRYANGGIAHKPQVSIFGEGAHREAYVPLPDGRTIPVTMKGGASPNVQFNLINQSGQEVEAEKMGGRFDGDTYVLDVVLKAISRPGNFRDSMKGAMRS